MDGSPLVESRARERDLVDRLLAQHVDDGTGHCPACPRGGMTGWLHSLATLAHETLAVVPAGHSTGSTR